MKEAKKANLLLSRYGLDLFVLSAKAVLLSCGCLSSSKMLLSSRSSDPRAGEAYIDKTQGYAIV